MDCLEVSSETVATTYNKIAKEFKNSRHYNWKWITQFISNINVDNASIIDIGCGGGRNIKAYQNDKLNIVGLDNCSEFIKICRNEGLDVVLSDMTNIPHPDENFDYILSIASFHHLTNRQERIKALTEFRRILKPGGKVLLSVWSKTQPLKTKRVFTNWGDTIVPWKSLTGEVFNRYYYIFKIPEIEELFEMTGFKIESHSWDCGNEVFILK